MRGGNTSSYRSSGRPSRSRSSAAAHSSAIGLGAAQVPGQRFLAVRPGEDLAGGQVVQFHPVAGAPQDAARGQRVQRQGQRAAGVVRGEHVPSGLVVHHHELGPLPDSAAPGVEAVDPPGDRDLVGAGRDRPFHPERLVGRVEPGDVPLDHRDGPLALAHRLGLVREALVDPAAVKQAARGRDGALGPRQPPPAGQGVVDAGAKAVVRPRRALRRRRPVQVAHPVPARAVQPGREPGRRARVEPPRHPLEAELLHRLPSRRGSTGTRSRGRPWPRSRTSSPPPRPSSPGPGPAGRGCPRAGSAGSPRSR